MNMSTLATQSAIRPPRRGRGPGRLSVAERLDRYTEPGTVPALWHGEPDDAARLLPCSTWTGGKTLGYGILRVTTAPGVSTTRYAHVLTVELAGIEIPDGYEVDHQCENHACRRLEHLRVTDHRTNGLAGTSPCAVNARKTYCDHGHLFDAANTYWRPDRPGTRSCRACAANRKQMAAWRG